MLGKNKQNLEGLEEEKNMFSAPTVRAEKCADGCNMDITFGRLCVVSDGKHMATGFGSYVAHDRHKHVALLHTN